MTAQHLKRAAILSAAEDAITEAKRWNALCDRPGASYPPPAPPEQMLNAAVARAKELLEAL